MSHLKTLVVGCTVKLVFSNTTQL